MRTVIFLLLAIFGAASAADEAIPSFTIVVERFIVEGDNPLMESETNAVLADFIGEYDSLDGLLAAKDALEQAFSSRGFSFHRAILPR